MSEEVKARCLEPFYSTKEDKGTGLGLGSVYGIVRRHEGEVDIQSEEGRGTSISISLPLDKHLKPWKRRSLHKRAPEYPTLADSRRGGAELLVREVIGVLPGRSSKHQVVTAENGREGLEKFEGRHV